MSTVNLRERFARELHAAVQANNPFLLRHLVRRIHQARIDAWTSGDDNAIFPSLDAPVSLQGITAFHLASFLLFCSKWAFSFARRTSRWRFELGMWAASTKPRQGSLAAFMNKPERGWSTASKIWCMG